MAEQVTQRVATAIRDELFEEGDRPKELNFYAETWIDCEALATAAIAAHRTASTEELERRGADAVIAEREACALLADKHADEAWTIGDRIGQNGVCSSGRNYGARYIADAIRARAALREE